MRKAEQEGMRREFLKWFNHQNRAWEFNGRAFVMKMGLYRNKLRMEAVFESRLEQVELSLRLSRAFGENVEIDTPRRKFIGDDCMAEALSWLADSFYTVLDEVQKREQEAIVGLWDSERLRRELQEIVDKLDDSA